MEEYIALFYVFFFHKSIIELYINFHYMYTMFVLNSRNNIFQYTNKHILLKHYNNVKLTEFITVVRFSDIKVSNNVGFKIIV